jgi:hypothetical protein
MTAEDIRIADLAAKQLGMFSRAQALALGMSKGSVQSRLRTGQWRRIVEGVYSLRGYPRTWERSLMAAYLSAGEDVLVSDRAAARLFGLARFDRSPVELTLRPNSHRKVPSDIALHWRHVDRKDICRRGPFRTTTPARTLVDLAGAVAPITLEIALDDALRKRLTSREALRRASARAGRRPGIPALERMLEVRNDDVVPQTPLETIVFSTLVEGGYTPPELQYPIYDGATLIATVDFAWPDQMVVVEADGFEFHSERTDWDRDKEKRAKIAALGYLVLPVTDAMARRRADLTDTVARALAGSRAGPRSSLLP